MEKIEKDLNEVIIWLRDYMKKYNFKGFVIGLSGGIDSAVSLGIAIKSVGVDNVKCISLPCTAINEIERLEDQDDADLISKTFGVKLEKIFLNKEANELYGKISEFNTENNKLVLSNIKARLRMVTLRSIAESLGYLVLGTTNKTEEYLGYYTKAGDGGHGVDIEPISDFFKNEIKILAKILGVPDKIINKKPSAGLFDNQTDEDEIGFKYDDIDEYLSYRENYINKNFKWKNSYNYMNQIIKYNKKEFNVDLMNKIENMISINQHKRNMPPYFKRN